MKKKIFNKCKQIDFESVIYQSKKDGVYKFVGVRDKRKEHESILYLIPNNINPNKPYLKGIQKSEIEKAWLRLLEVGVLTKAWFKENLKECEKEGGCNFKAICGIICFLNPEIYKIGHGKLIKI